MPISMKERYERAKQHQKDAANNRFNKRNKIVLPVQVVTQHRIKTLDKQLGLCAICSKDIRENTKLIHLDHCHDTGQIRGILCHNCNVGLGHFKDDVDLLLAAVDYLEKFRPENDKLRDKQSHTKHKRKVEVEPIKSLWGVLTEVKPFVKPDNWWWNLNEIMDYSNVEPKQDS